MDIEPGRYRGVGRVGSVVVPESVCYLRGKSGWWAWGSGMEFVDMTGRALTSKSPGQEAPTFVPELVEFMGYVPQPGPN